jgi:hypothetical protein
LWVRGASLPFRRAAILDSAQWVSPKSLQLRSALFDWDEPRFQTCGLQIASGRRGRGKPLANRPCGPDARVVSGVDRKRQWRASMKSILSLIALGLAVSVTAPAFAEDKPPATKAECDKVPDMEWDESQGKCVRESPGG